ncbi:MAG TPA: heme A synthase [Pseudogracilibacillus sp.]|nr:heme A synthase [Pseudogracilibacillus sp.]
MIRSIKWLGVVSTIGMIFILLGGALVTKTDSGAGCGKSWPLCNGSIIPSEITPELVIELSHRLVSSVVGITVVLLAVLAWKRIGHIREVKFLSILSVFFLLLQGLVGAAAVVWGQSDFVLALHFGISLISFAAVLLLTLLVFEIDQKFDATALHIKRKHRIEIFAITIFTIVVVYTGALVRHVDASLVCQSWPFCSNQDPFSFSNYNFFQWVQMGHRLLAGSLFIWTTIFFGKIYRSYKNNKVMIWGWLSTWILITLQVLFGAFVIFTGLNLWIAILHAFFITCYFGNLSYFMLLANRSAKYESVKEVEQTATPASPIKPTSE